MHRTAISLSTRLAAGAAGLLMGIVGMGFAPAAAQAAAGQVSGTFSGTSDQLGVQASWHGAVNYGPSGSGSAATYKPTTGSVSWSVAGTDISGCSYSGSGQFGFAGGQLAGHPVGGYASVNSDGTYYVGLDTIAQGPIAGFNTLPVTVTCPNETPITEDYPLADWLDVSHATGRLMSQGGILSGSDSFSSGPYFSQSWRWDLTVPPCPQPNVRTGKGYAELSAEMKARLDTLYSILDRERACYHFNIGFRSETYQQDLYDRWHQIADHHQNDPTAVCKRLKAAGFAQCPVGWNSKGIALGGPARPGVSRHEKAQAADITVTFPLQYVANVARFRAASHQAGLCGPPSSDPVHVELPYKKGREKVASCHFD